MFQSKKIQINKFIEICQSNKSFRESKNLKKIALKTAGS